MVLSDEREEQLRKKLLDLCRKLNLDQKTISLAWDNFLSIHKNFTLEGDSLHWLGCAIYVATQSVELSTLSTSSVRGNGVNLTSLLRYSNLSFLQFFANINRWADMAHLPDDFRNRINHLKDTFGVAHNTFKRFYPIFAQIFAAPTAAELDPTKQHRSRKIRPIWCNTSKVFEFLWNLFIYLKQQEPQCATELIRSYHLLYVLIDLAFKNAFLGERRDLLNPNFECLPADWNNPAFVVPQEAPCLISYLCKCPDLVTEAKHMKVYTLKRLMGNLIDSQVLFADSNNFTGLFDPDNFELNCKNVVNAYDTYLLNSAELDERIFLAEYRRQLLEAQQHANWAQITRIASPVPDNYSVTSPGNGENLIGQRGSDTPLTGRGYLPREVDISSLSIDKPISQQLIRSHIFNSGSSTPSDALVQLFSNCDSSALSLFEKDLEIQADKFVSTYTNIFPNREEEARKLVQMGLKLFYRFLESILENERRLRNDISPLLKKILLYQCIFACCMEVVLFCHNFPKPFPWILEVFDIQPLHFVKVIELIVRSKDQLSRELVKHLNRIEETILETLMWKSDSPIWEAITSSGETIPKFEITALPGHLVSSDKNGTNADSPSNSNTHSPVSALERFQSPVNSTNRQMFSNVQSGQSLLPKHTHIMLTDKEGNKKFIPIVETEKTQISNTESSATPPPRKLGSLAIIFRKFYNLAGIRMEHLCTKLNLTELEVKQKIWTVFEESIRNTDLIRDRHLDQLLMCAIYVICRISNSTLKFQEIMKFYREQPQSGSSVYRDVLITRGVQEGNNIVPEKRNDLIIFYNSVYVDMMQRFAVKFRSSGQNNNLLLSPLPALKRDLMSSGMQVVGNVFVRPFESPSTTSASSFHYIFSRSPSKDLKEINKLVSNNRVTGKRLWSEDGLENDLANNKKLKLSKCKFQSLVEERRNQNGE